MDLTDANRHPSRGPPLEPSSTEKPTGSEEIREEEIQPQTRSRLPWDPPRSPAGTPPPDPGSGPGRRPHITLPVRGQGTRWEASRGQREKTGEGTAFEEHREQPLGPPPRCSRSRGLSVLVSERHRSSHGQEPSSRVKSPATPGPGTAAACPRGLGCELGFGAARRMWERGGPSGGLEGDPYSSLQGLHRDSPSSSRRGREGGLRPARFLQGEHDFKSLLIKREPPPRTSETGEGMWSLATSTSNSRLD